MLGLWKTLAAPLLVLVVGAYLVGRFQSAEVPTIEARYSAVEIPSPVSAVNRSQLEEIAKAGRSGLKVANLDVVVTWAAYQRTLRVVTLEISNNSSLRSKEFEAFGRDEGALIGVPDNDGTLRFERRGRLKALDPGATIRIMIFAPGWPNVPVTLLHDGKKVELASRELNDLTGYFAEVINDYPGLSFAAVAGVLILAFIGLLILLLALWSEFVSQEIRLRATAPKELSKTLAFMAYAKQHDPEKYAEAERMVSKPRADQAPEQSKPST